jgi:hypothetical protein
MMLVISHSHIHSLPNSHTNFKLSSASFRPCFIYKMFRSQVKYSIILLEYLEVALHHFPLHPSNLLSCPLSAGLVVSSFAVTTCTWVLLPYDFTFLSCVVNALLVD